ncbi:DNA repair RAD52-like protein 2, chloroplastic isoform X1 [Lycium ferocissimum]|uniref:DNA repair RAD52-like protein 2, chloroplastic isoform X1 n=1 Tax=Lycium ferocissimum TaxID=112874 RepID=UPI002815FDAC|nr:DNA repair RAD52-like protein 2, chloroplastic isoform X1 [Lycium ferocissimum]
MCKLKSYSTRASLLQVKALDCNSNNNNNYSSTGDVTSCKNATSSSSVSNTNYVVQLDKSSSSCITRPLAEILRDLNNIIKADDGDDHYTWYHANQMLSFYAPGWCGEVRNVISPDNGSVTVVYRVTIRGSDGEAHRESTGTVSPGNGHSTDLVVAAEKIAFCRACACFGLGLYPYH